MSIHNTFYDYINIHGRNIDLRVVIDAWERLFDHGEITHDAYDALLDAIHAYRFQNLMPGSRVFHVPHGRVEFFCAAIEWIWFRFCSAHAAVEEAIDNDANDDVEIEEIDLIDNELISIDSSFSHFDDNSVGSFELSDDEVTVIDLTDE